MQRVFISILDMGAREHATWPRVVPPDQRDPVMSRGGGFDSAHEHATASAQNKGAFRQLRRNGKILLCERLSLDSGNLRIRERQI